jgi:hypothetical protein
MRLGKRREVDQTHLLAIRAVEGVRSTPIWSPPVTSLARRSGLARRVRTSSWECMPRASSAFCASSNALGLIDPLFFAWLDLLRMESSRSKARRGAAWMWPKEGWPAQHGARARERREVSLVEITTGVHRGAGGTWGAKKALQIGHGCN